MKELFLALCFAIIICCFALCVLLLFFFYLPYRYMTYTDEVKRQGRRERGVMVTETGRLVCFERSVEA